MTEEVLNDQDKALASLAEKLTLLRESRGVSLVDMAGLLHVSESVVRAIEVGDRANMPKPVFVKGYVASYLRILNESDNAFETLVARAFPVEKEASVMIDVKPSKLDRFDDSESRGWVKWLLLFLLLGAVGVSLVFGYQKFFANDLGPTSAGSSSEMQELDLQESQADESLPEEDALGDVDDNSIGMSIGTGEIEPQLEGVSATPEVTDQETSVVVETDEIGAEPLNGDADETAVIIGEPEGRDVAPVEEVSAIEEAITRVVGEGENQLTLTFTDDCWVEVTTESGNKLTADLYTSTKNLVVNTDEPIELFLGYAPGVEVRYNGELVEFSIPRSNMKRFVVPQG